MTKDERTLFFTGLGGVAAVVALISYVPCPSVTQSWYLSIALALMSALVASQIPGVLNINFSPGVSSKVKAGGAVAVFAMIAFVKPVALGGTEAERRFSNVSCQGPVPEGKELHKSALPRDLNPTVKGAIEKNEALGRPVKFIFNYTFGEFAGPRNWTQVKEGVWIETYPDGNIFTAFREVGRLRRGNCDGIVVERQDSSGFRVFIPDKGCDNALFWTQKGADEWHFLGKMESVE